MDYPQRVIIGSGPAGMAAAHTLALKKVSSLVIDQNDTLGGLCRTLNYAGYLFDIGGHRFISKSSEVNDLWRNIMGDDMLRVRRLSRIYYRNRYFAYPLSFLNTFWNLGPLDSLLCVGSYLKYKYFKRHEESTLAGWITKRFGKKLFDIFFKTYSEKVWGLPCDFISADWANQRIRGLSLRVAIQNACLRNKAQAPKTLCEEFSYPRTGPGEFQAKLKDRVHKLSDSVFLQGKRMVSLQHQNHRLKSMEIQDCSTGEISSIPLEYLFSTAPLPKLINSLRPAAPEPVLEAAGKLKFRSFLIVNAIFRKRRLFDDQWLYIHSPEVKLARIQNYKNWSPAMVADQEFTSLGLEYFCNEFDDFWNQDDTTLINFALTELEKIKIVERKFLVNAFVVRNSDAYPIYHMGYQTDLNIIRQYLQSFTNLLTFGRAGTFRYDNSDHALLSGRRAAEIFLGEAAGDLWNLNIDEGYLES